MKKGISFLLAVLVAAMCLTLVACDGSTFDDDSGKDNGGGNGDNDGNDNGDGVSENGKEGIASLSAWSEALRGDVYGFEIRDYENGNEYRVLKVYRNGDDFNIYNFYEAEYLNFNSHMIILDGVVYFLNDEKEIYEVEDREEGGWREPVPDKSYFEWIVGELTPIPLAVRKVDMLNEALGSMEIRDTGEGSFLGNTYYYEEYPLPDIEDIPDPASTYIRVYYDDDGNFVGWCNEQGQGTAFKFTSNPDMSNFKLPSNYTEVDNDIDSYDIDDGYDIDVSGIFGMWEGVLDYEYEFGGDLLEDPPSMQTRSDY